MTYVYLLSQSWDYDGEYVIGVYASLDSAKRAAEAHHNAYLGAGRSYPPFPEWRGKLPDEPVWIADGACGADRVCIERYEVRP